LGRRNIHVANPPTPDDRRLYHSLDDMWYLDLKIPVQGCVSCIGAYMQRC
jgi:hypothetical protein